MIGIHTIQTFLAVHYQGNYCEQFFHSFFSIQTCVIHGALTGEEQEDVHHHLATLQELLLLIPVSS